MRVIRNLSFLLLVVMILAMWPSAPSAQIGICNAGADDLGCEEVDENCEGPPDLEVQGDDACWDNCCSGLQSVDLYCRLDGECGDQWHVQAAFQCEGVCGPGGCSMTTCSTPNDCCDDVDCVWGECEWDPF